MSDNGSKQDHRRRSARRTALWLFVTAAAVYAAFVWMAVSRA